MYQVVKLLSKRWRIPIGARLEGPKLEQVGSPQFNPCIYQHMNAIFQNSCNNRYVPLIVFPATAVQ